MLNGGSYFNYVMHVIFFNLKNVSDYGRLLFKVWPCGLVDQ